MNVLLEYKEMVFFYLAKAPAERVTNVDADVVKERLRILLLPQTEEVFRQQSNKEDIAGFYQCMALFRSLGQNEQKAWLELERAHLQYKVQCYWSSICALCKMEDVAAYRKRNNDGTLVIKFPWEKTSVEVHTAFDVASAAVQSIFSSDASIQQRVVKYRVSDATKQGVLQWMRQQGIKC